MKRSYSLSSVQNLERAKADSEEQDQSDDDIGEMEREMLDNVSWDTNSNEEFYEHDEQCVKFFRKMTSDKKKKE